MINNNALFILSDENTDRQAAQMLSQHLGAAEINDASEISGNDLVLHFTADGLALESNGQTMRCDFSNMLRRLRKGNLSGELLVKASKLKKFDGVPTVIDATAGLGEDSLLLAAAGFSVKLYERNPVIAALLKDAIQRAENNPELSDIVKRMEVFEADSITQLPRLAEKPDVIFLDPMFPEKTKTALTKKKFQLLHLLEHPCKDEAGLLAAAIAASPKKIVIKRPLKEAFLDGHKPDYSLKGKAIRYDCILLPIKQKG